MQKSEEQTDKKYEQLRYAEFYVKNDQRNRTLRKYTVINSAEKKLVDQIKKELAVHELEYYIEPKYPKILELEVENMNRPFSVRILVLGQRIDIVISYPFRVLQKAIALLTLYLDEEDECQSNIHLDIVTGKLTMKYSFLCCNPDIFDTDAFWQYILLMFHSALNVYRTLQELSVGLVPPEYRSKYKTLLEASALACEDYCYDFGLYGTKEFCREYNNIETPIREKKNSEFDDGIIDKALDAIDKVITDDEPSQNPPAEEKAEYDDNILTMNDYLAAMNNITDEDKDALNGDE